MRTNLLLVGQVATNHYNIRLQGDQLCQQASRGCAVQITHRSIVENKDVKGGIVAMFEQALAIGSETDDMGILLNEDYREVLAEYGKGDSGIRTGFAPLDDLWRNGWAAGWLIVPLAPPKRYKCEHPDTRVLMFDGTVKRICEVKAGEKLMGDDSTPRTVLSCGTGYGAMCKVTQANGESYTVTSDHVLCLKRPAGTEPIGRFDSRYHGGSFLEITAEEYAKKPAWFRRTWKGYKVGVEFPYKEVPLDPYLLGLWLGDGTRNAPSIAVGDEDPEILSYLRRAAFKEGTGYREHRVGRCVQFHFVRKTGKGTNPVTGKLRALGVWNSKHIPAAYRINSTTVRMQLLAGLIDSDGNYTKNRGFIYTGIDEKLCQDTCWLARSLGFKSFVRKVPTQCTYRGKKIYSTAYRTYIQGKISAIPTKVARKRGTDSAKASDRTTIHVEPAGNGQWFGVEIDGNRKYLHGDFTVTHNTTWAINLALNMVHENICGDVIYYACEISQQLASVRALCAITGNTIDDLLDKREVFIANAEHQMPYYSGKFLLKSYASKSTPISAIKAHAKRAIKRYGLKPRAIFIDYAETVRPESAKDTPEYRQQSDIYTQARAMGHDLKCCIIMPDRCTIDFVDRPVPNMKAFQGAFEKAGIVDAGIGLCQTDAEKQQGTMRYFVFLNRHGPEGRLYQGTVEPERYRMTVDREIPYNPDDADITGDNGRGGSSKHGGRNGGHGVANRATDRATAKEV